MTHKQLTVVDLFAGAGGLSEGFQRQGFLGLAHIEMDSYACQTLQTRHIYWELVRNNKKHLYYDYLNNKISRDELVNIFGTDNPVINETIGNESLGRIKERLHNKIKARKISQVDVFVGGPPCQAYSLVGRARDPYGMENDPRNQLYRFYVGLLKEFNPKLFVFENVPGILSAGNGELWKDIQRYFKKAGYIIKHEIVNAADFLVPQTRKRVILIGWQEKLNLEYPKLEKQSHNYLFKDIFIDLPSLKPGERIEAGGHKASASNYLKMAKIRVNGAPLIQHITRPTNEQDREIYGIALDKWENKNERLSYTDLPKKLRTHNNCHSFLDRFKVVAKNLPTCHTLVAHISKDGHYYIHPDKKQLRSISVREAARIQSFPDDFKFEGPRTSQFIQIGNAVPPLMAENIAAKIKEMLL
ncbi:MAG: DNA (cytosine-5-)-methyltransferase [Planctomycetes bacterium GWC2_45_44]|nr:MAG: DNA (cytosine-5-)-methyltransferase [Planctomycetes bacterium GWC2_45_44]